MIAVLGASGEVGRHAVAALARAGVGPLLLGGRRPEAVSTEEAGPGARVMAVDATDPAALARFCAGSRLVLNCAGPSYLFKETVARAALAAGADYVDVLGDDPVAEALAAAGAPAAGRTAVLSAGTVPGLSVLVPRHVLALIGSGEPPATALTVHAGGLERATPTVAADILLSLTTGGVGGERFGHPLAAWRDGRREQRVLRTDESAEVPFYPGRVAVQPLLTAEIERLAASVPLERADWYNVFPGRRTRALFTALPTLPVDTPEQRAEVIGRVIRASEADLAGADPYYRMVFTLSAPTWSRTAVVRAGDSYRLTGSVAALTVRALLAGRIPPGLHFAGDVLDPGEVVAELAGDGAAEVEVFATTAPGGAPAELAFEDGAL
ncbi:saccharopine dehydrogenase NADP-binding domain-containing protein [Streptomyces carpaticus]|uniref:Saccharopine dehydrogenase NADP-binding domain-containing protein n=1 Tax=Streptomyces carpaticus TaxID=285558 RepID=A0ABV4ZIL8_9ACTN